MYLSYGCKNILYQGSSDAQSTEKTNFKCRTQQNLRKCKALETEIDGEIERVNSITGVSSVSKEPRQTNLFTD